MLVIVDNSYLYTWQIWWCGGRCWSKRVIKFWCPYEGPSWLMKHGLQSHVNGLTLTGALREYWRCESSKVKQNSLIWELKLLYSIYILKEKKRNKNKREEFDSLEFSSKKKKKKVHAYQKASNKNMNAVEFFFLINECCRVFDTETRPLSSCVFEKQTWLLLKFQKPNLSSSDSQTINLIVSSFKERYMYYRAFNKWVSIK